MLRKSATAKVPEGEGVTEVTPPLSHEHLIEERLDLIVHYMERADKRDRWRTVGGGIRSVLTLIPMLLFLGSLLYLYFNGQSLLQRISDEAAKSAAKYAQQSTEGFLDKVKGLVPK